MKKNKRFKKGIAYLLTMAMMVGAIIYTPNGMLTVHAKEGADAVESVVETVAELNEDILAESTVSANDVLIESAPVDIKNSVQEIGQVDVRDIIAPVAGVALDTEAVCETTGIDTDEQIVVTWTKGEGKEVVSGNAEYNTAYTANVTLSCKLVYCWGETVTATVNGDPATVTINDTMNESRMPAAEDRTITVSYTFPATEEEESVIRIEMSDSYGDGWNSASISVKCGGEEIETCTIVSGNSNKVTIPYDFRKEYTFIWKGGSYDHECSFTIYIDGNEVYSCNGAKASSLGDGEVFYTEGINCSHEFPENSSTCTICSNTCGIDFEHKEVEGVCTICRAVIPTYVITVNSSEHGTVVVEDPEASEGQEIQLQITPQQGYVLSELKVTTASGAEIEVEENTFVMPNEAVTVTATFKKDSGDFVIEGAAEGWHWMDDVLTFTQSGAYTVSMASGKEQTNQVIVVDGTDVTLTLKEVTINAPNGGSGAGVCALTTGDTTNLILVGNNTLTGGRGGYSGGMEKKGYNGGDGIRGDAVILGDGTLYVSGGTGGNSMGDNGANGGHGVSGTATINSGIVVAGGGTGGKVENEISGYYKDGEDGKAFGSLVANANHVILAGTGESDATDVASYESQKYARVTVSDGVEYSIVTSECENGSVVADKTVAKEGQSVTLSLAPEANYSMFSITVKDASDHSVSLTKITENTYRFYMPGSAVTVDAKFGIVSGDFVVKATTEGYGYSEGVLQFTQSGEYSVAMKSGKTETNDRIEVTAEDVTLTLYDVVINAPQAGSEENGKTALTLGSPTNLNVVGECKLTGGKGYVVEESATDSGHGISGDAVVKGGWLQVIGGEGVAGYHGGHGGNGIQGNVTVLEGSLIVKGGDGGEGRGANGGNGRIAITGNVVLQTGTIEAVGGTGGAGDVPSYNGEPGKALGGQITIADGMNVSIIAGEDEASADVVESYTDERYAKLTAAKCEHTDDGADGYCDACKTMINGKAALKGRTLVLGGDIGVVFYYELTDEMQNADTRVDFALANGKTSSMSFDEAKDRIHNEDGKTYYGFMCKVHATEMNQVITAKLYSGEELLITQDYLVKEYCTNQMNSPEQSNETVVDLIEALVLYGGMAQTYFGVQTDNLVTEDFEDLSLPELTSEEKAVLNEYTKEVTENKEDAGISCLGMSLVLYSETAMRTYFSLDEGRSMDNFTFTVKNEATGADVTETIKFGESASGSYLEIPGIGATNLDSNYTITVAEGEETVLTVTYSPFTYFKNKLAYIDTNTENTELDQTELTNLENVITAMYRYNRAAEAYAREN